jgi:hypothetical protein
MKEIKQTLVSLMPSMRYSHVENPASSEDEELTVFEISSSSVSLNEVDVPCATSADVTAAKEKQYFVQIKDSGKKRKPK